MDHKSHEAMRAYLLGLLSDDQAAVLEEEYFVNRALFLKVRSEETALIADYLDGHLRGREKQSFETRYLQIPDLRNRVEEARKERAVLRVRPSPVWRSARLGWAAALMLILGFGTLAYYLRTGEGVRPPTTGQLPGSSSPTPVPPPSASDFAIFLSPGVTKGSGAVQTSFPQPAAEVTVKLILELPGTSSRVERTAEILLVKPDGAFASVWTSSHPIASTFFYNGPKSKFLPKPAGTSHEGQSSQVLPLSLPGSLFQPGDYLVKARTTDGKLHGTYAFRVTERQ